MEVRIDGRLYVPQTYPKIGEFAGRDVHKGTILYDKTKESWNIAVDFIAFRSYGIVFVSSDGRELLAVDAKFGR